MSKPEWIKERLESAPFLFSNQSNQVGFATFTRFLFLWSYQ
jgi:hypothetical protein